jgi:DNA primase (bacterial type)
VVGFGGRVIDEEDDPKYLNSPETTLFKKRLSSLWSIRRQTRNLSDKRSYSC